jgi:hypothetical protein
LALGALELDAEEDAGGVGGALVGGAGADVAEQEGGGAVALGRVAGVHAALGRHQGAGDLGPRAVGLELLVQPGLQGRRTGQAQEHLGGGGPRQQHLTPVARLVAGVGIAVEQLVNQFGALVGGLVRREARHLLRRGRPAGQVEADAADELLVGGARGGRDAGLAQLAVEEAVDLVGLERRLGRRPPDLRHQRHRRRVVLRPVRGAAGRDD